MQWMGVGFHPDAFVADVEIGDHQRTCRSWSKTRFSGIVTAKTSPGGRRSDVRARQKRGRPRFSPSGEADPRWSVGAVRTG
jgi:hypothetical protein